MLGYEYIYNANDSAFLNTYAGELGTILSIALQRHRLLHGEFPERLDDLLEDGLDSIPKDPWTQAEFGYWPRGYIRSQTGEIREQPLLYAGKADFIAESIPVTDGRTLLPNPDRIRFQLGYESAVNTNWKWPTRENPGKE